MPGVKWGDNDSYLWQPVAPQRIALTLPPHPMSLREREAHIPVEVTRPRSPGLSYIVPIFVIILVLVIFVVVSATGHQQLTKDREED